MKSATAEVSAMYIVTLATAMKVRRGCEVRYGKVSVFYEAASLSMLEIISYTTGKKVLRECEVRYGYVYCVVSSSLAEHALKYSIAKLMIVLNVS